MARLVLARSCVGADPAQWERAVQQATKVTANPAFDHAVKLAATVVGGAAIVNLGAAAMADGEGTAATGSGEPQGQRNAGAGGGGGGGGESLLRGHWVAVPEALRARRVNRLRRRRRRRRSPGGAAGASAPAAAPQVSGPLRPFWRPF
jgi:hypothetical protein